MSISLKQRDCLVVLIIGWSVGDEVSAPHWCAGQRVPPTCGGPVLCLQSLCQHTLVRQWQPAKMAAMAAVEAESPALPVLC